MNNKKHTSCFLLLTTLIIASLVIVWNITLAFQINDLEKKIDNSNIYQHESFEALVINDSEIRKDARERADENYIFVTNRLVLLARHLGVYFDYKEKQEQQEELILVPINKRK